MTPQTYPAGFIGPVDNARRERLMQICDLVRGIGPKRVELRFPSYADQEPALQRAALNALPVDGPATVLPMARQLAGFSKIMRAGASIIPSQKFQSLVVPTVNRSLRATFAATTPDVGADPIDAALPTPKRISAFIQVSDQLKQQNELLTGAFVERQLLSAIGTGIDYAALSGSGTGEPLGILNDGDVLTHTRATADVTTFADLVAMEEAVAAAHGEDDPASFVWLVAPDVRESLRQTPIAVGGDRMAFDASARTILGYPAAVLPDAPAKTAILAQAPQIAVVDWGKLEIESLRTVAEAKSGFHTLLVSGWLDVVSLDPNAFCVATNP